MASPPPSTPATEVATRDRPLPAHRRSAPVRLAFLALGWLFVAFGAAGAVLPVLPTTPFVLLAAACWGRSSRRFHLWLWQHRVFGRTLRAWHARRALPPGVKGRAIALVVATFAASLVLGPSSTALRAGLVLTGVALVVFLARLPVWEESEVGGESGRH